MKMIPKFQQKPLVIPKESLFKRMLTLTLFPPNLKFMNMSLLIKHLNHI